MPAIRHPYQQLAAAGHAARHAVANLARVGAGQAEVAQEVVVEAREYDRPFWQSVDYGRLEAARRRSGPRLGTCR